MTNSCDHYIEFVLIDIVLSNLLMFIMVVICELFDWLFPLAYTACFAFLDVATNANLILNLINLHYHRNV